MMKNTVLALFIGLALLIQPVGSALARQDDVRLPELFSRLQQTADLQEARLIEGLIWSLWFESGDLAIDRMIAAGNDAMGAGRFD